MLSAPMMFSFIPHFVVDLQRQILSNKAHTFVFFTLLDLKCSTVHALHMPINHWACHLQYTRMFPHVMTYLKTDLIL